jgi:hypothetical protein
MTNIELGEARHIASEWHSGQWSALYAFSSSGTIQSGLESEVETIISECERRLATGWGNGPDFQDPAELLQQARDLLDFVTQPITSVWSNHGHRFLHEDGYASCLTCGGEWELIHDDPEDPSHGAYVASNGDAATECLGTTAQHGEDRAEDDDRPCNCVLCA